MNKRTIDFHRHLQHDFVGIRLNYDGKQTQCRPLCQHRLYLPVRQIKPKTTVLSLGLVKMNPLFILPKRSKHETLSLTFSHKMNGVYDGLTVHTTVLYFSLGTMRCVAWVNIQSLTGTAVQPPTHTGCTH